MKGEIIITLFWLLTWLLTSHALTEREGKVCPACGESLVQGLDTLGLYCVRCRRWQR